MDPLIVLLLLAGGFGAGFINTLAGAGSVLTLPILMFAGLDPQTANASNRVGVLLQTAGATLTFRRAKVSPTTEGYRATLPVFLGSLFGAVVASYLPTQWVGHIFAGVFASLAVLMALKPGWLSPPKLPEGTPPKRLTGRTFALFALVGLYGGGFQAGVGIPLMLVAVRGLGLNLKSANALKAIAVLVLTVVALITFQSRGQIDWLHGAVLGVGSLLGGVTGARVAVKHGDKLVQRLVLVALIAAALKSAGVF